MNTFEYGPAETSYPNIALEFRDLVRKIKTSESRPAIMDAARSVFERVQGCWRPALAHCWVDYTHGDASGTLVMPRGQSVAIRPGHSNQFLSPARHALAGIYTAGPEMDELSVQASREGNFLDAHLIDQIGLAVLDKLERRIKTLAEQKASAAGWGVSPFLSPGSVHGWDLEEQVRLASLLPIHEINVRISDSGVFSPFKTISCLIGIGPGYASRQVGTTCRACSKRDTCQMRHPQGQHP